MASGSVLSASRSLRQRILEVAAHLLEVSPNDLEIDNATVVPRGAPMRSLSLAEIANQAYMAPEGLPEGLDARLDVTEFYAPGPEEGGWASATHVCVVEVDAHTGFVGIPRYLVVEACGRMVNPAIVEGQIRGGVAQGIGGMLHEHAAYDNVLRPTRVLELMGMIES